MVTQVRKRDGRIVDFDKEKITNAIFNAAQAVGGKDRQLASMIANHVERAVLEQFEDTIASVEEIQDLVEKILIENGHAKTAKAYILYREQHSQIRDMKHLFVNVHELMDGYLDQVDWRVKENGNMTYSLSGLMMHTTGAIMANYTLSKVYPREVGEAHRRGDLHIHDLSMGISGYCAGWSLRQLLTEGFNGVLGKTDSKPAKHLDSALWQMINFIGTLQNEWAGAQAFSSFDTYLAPFIKQDNLPYEKVKQAIQGFIFNMNVPSRWGGQTPFSNLTFDWIVPDDMKETPALLGGEAMSFTYGECQKEMDVINRAFMEVMMEGDASGRVFTFPIPTYNITKEFNWESENANMLFEMTAKYGIPYFQNFINSDLNPSDVRSMCCRLQMDLRELRKRGGGLFGAAEMTGSLGVVTINLPRVGFLSKTKEEFFKRLEYLMQVAKKSLEIKRKLVQKNMDNGLMPYSKRYLGTLKNHFSTIGIVGMNEALVNFMNKTLVDPQGRAFALEVMDFMRAHLQDFQEETENIYNLEATPAEGTAYRLARIDKKLYPDIIVANESNAAEGAEPYYTNSTHLPVGSTDDIFEALELQDALQTKYTGGTVLHGFMGERLIDRESCKMLVKRIAHNYKLPYFTMTPTFSICPVHGYLTGEHQSCPQTHTPLQYASFGVESANNEGTTVQTLPCEVFSRVVGYFRPVQNWNHGKREEFKDRRTYNEHVSHQSGFAKRGED
ncbi:ribonucleoside triphosphate reductase [archaeon CG10_big_fil_rev_8_21_14_0_10_43_11]|nr:MAG: ribonucleoside triphosphate reductase [archaeon CG10_big_fil_rev_8_21_14_0_10_43_11]